MVIIALVFNASTGFAIRITHWVIGDYDVKTDLDFGEGRRLVEHLVYFLGVLVAFLTIPPILFFRTKPLTPPSFTASDVLICIPISKAMHKRKLCPSW
jgi:FLVCR family feline leukemia virus subgroup C receptor-related protein